MSLSLFLSNYSSVTQFILPFTIVIFLVPGPIPVPLSVLLITLPSSDFSLRSEFKIVTGGGRLMRLDMLLDWKEIKELLEDGVITQKQVG